MKTTFHIRLRKTIGFMSICYRSGLILSFMLGAAASAMTHVFAVDAQSNTHHEKPAYLIASWKTIHPGQIESIKAAIVPLAEKAGYVLLGASVPQVLEGTWPYDGIVIVQRYRSMEALRDFWFSPEHAAAKKLREGHIDSHFVVAVEAQE